MDFLFFSVNIDGASLEDPPFPECESLIQVRLTSVPASPPSGAPGCTPSHSFHHSDNLFPSFSLLLRSLGENSSVLVLKDKKNSFFLKELPLSATFPPSFAPKSLWN